MACRICLDTEQPFVQPCKCSGSMADVHEACLLQWLDVKQSQRPVCELCKTPFRIRYSHPLEAYEEINRINGYFFVYPSWHILSTCVLQILFTKLGHIQPMDAYLYAQLLYLSFYMPVNSFLVIGALRSPTLYLRYAIDGGLFVALFLHVHLWILLCILFLAKNTQILFMFLSIANQCYLGIYPILHNQVIQKMNRERRRVIV